MVTIEQIQSFIPKKQIQKYYKAYNLSWAEKDGQAYIYIKKKELKPHSR
jgi:hypothetical protein